LKIILVGTGIVLSPHEYFQFIRTLKNVNMNSDGRFWTFWKSTFWKFQKGLLEGEGEQDTSWGGEVELQGAPQGTPKWHINFEKGILHWHFGNIGFQLYPLAILKIGGHMAAISPHSCSHTSHA
jgi:hypothetical protein